MTKKSDSEFYVTLTEERTRFDEQTDQLLKTTHELFSKDGAFDQLTEAMDDVCEVLTATQENEILEREKYSSAETRLENARKRKLAARTYQEHVSGPLWVKTFEDQQVRRWKMLAGIRDRPIGVPDLPKPRINVTETSGAIRELEFQRALEQSRRVLRETLNGGRRVEVSTTPQTVENQPDIPENYRGGIHEEYMKLKKENELLKKELVKKVQNELSDALATAPRMNFFQRMWKWFKSLFR